MVLSKFTLAVAEALWNASLGHLVLGSRNVCRFRSNLTVGLVWATRIARADGAIIVTTGLPASAAGGRAEAFAEALAHATAQGVGAIAAVSRVWSSRSRLQGPPHSAGSLAAQTTTVHVDGYGRFDLSRSKD
jgi:hypothetical protein